jgi:hypothetical protein
MRSWVLILLKPSISNNSTQYVVWLSLRCVKSATKTFAEIGPSNSRQTSNKYRWIIPSNYAFIHTFSCNYARIHAFSFNDIRVHAFSCNSIAWDAFSCNYTSIDSFSAKDQYLSIFMYRWIIVVICLSIDEKRTQLYVLPIG